MTRLIVRRCRTAIKTLGCRLLGRSDVLHWANLGNHDPDWDERARLIAEMIPPVSCVLEFGAGRRTLERHLNQPTAYLPSDIVSRGPDTLVCDLNARPLPDYAHLGATVVVFAGVLEYLSDVPAIVGWLPASARMCVASYECARSQPGTIERLREILSRSALGWVNMYSRGEIVALFESRGFALTGTRLWVTPDGNEPIFAFERT